MLRGSIHTQRGRSRCAVAGKIYRAEIWTGPPVAVFSVATAKDILIETAKWLVNNRYITSNVLPVSAPWQKNRYLINSTKLHPNGKPFVCPEQINQGMWLETHYSLKDCIKLTQWLLETYTKRYDISIALYVKGVRMVIVI